MSIINNDVSCQHLHNALKAIEENNIDLAYKEICIHIVYNNGKLEEHEENYFLYLIEKRYTNENKK